MRAMALSAILLTIAAAVFSVGAFADPDEVRHRGAWRALAAGSLIIGISMWLLVSYAQRPTCVALGGRWIEESEACRNEWGGNGNNDPNNPTFVVVAEVQLSRSLRSRRPEPPPSLADAHTPPLSISTEHVGEHRQIGGYPVVWTPT